MAKRGQMFNCKGDYDKETGIITEYNNKGECTGQISILEELSKFDGLAVSINIKHEVVIGQEVDGE